MTMTTITGQTGGSTSILPNTNGGIGIPSGYQPVTSVQFTVGGVQSGGFYQNQLYVSTTGVVSVADNGNAGFPASVGFGVDGTSVSWVCTQ